VIRRESAEWPRFLTPARGCYPLAEAPRDGERVLHVALRTATERQPGLARALRAYGEGGYAEVEWRPLDAHPSELKMRLRLLEAARNIKPTVVFMQVQSPSPITVAILREMRGLCEPDCVVINWDADLHHEPESDARKWFVELGREVDASLTVETAFQARYAALGVKRPGFLEIGVDGDLYRPVAPTADLSKTREVVFLAGCYAMHARRQVFVEKLAKTLDLGMLGLFGRGWVGRSARPMLAQEDEAAVYAAAGAALSMSIRNDVARYTSDRLFRLLASGGVPVVERFDDCEGLGLVDGENCLLWSTFEELLDRLDLVRRSDAEVALRIAAARLGSEHTWMARIPELAAVVEGAREARARGI